MRVFDYPTAWHRNAILVLMLLWGSPLAAQPTTIATLPVGGFPRGAAVNPNTNRIYVSAGGSVSVLDGATNTVLTTIVLDCLPWGCNTVGVGVNPNTDRIYVADPVNGWVFVIDGISNSVVDRISIGGSALGVGVNPNTDRVYVTNPTGLINTVAVIDGATNSVIATIPISDGPRDVGVNPVTNLIYVASDFGHEVSVIDGATNAITQVIAFGASSNIKGIGVNHNTNRIYVTGGPNSVFVIDGVTNSIVGSIPVGGSPTSDVGVNPGTNRLYVRHSGNVVDVLNGDTNSFVTAVVAGQGGNPPAMAVNPVTTLIYVTNDFDNTVSVIDDPAARPGDGDGDGVPNPGDNCPGVANADQTDTDFDGLGNACDPDDDNDFVADASDNCPLNPNSDQTDADVDNVGGACDPFGDRVGQTGTTERVSVDSFGTQGNQISSAPSISADGRFVAFSSNATNFVLGGTNGTRHVFVHDRQTGTTEHVSVDSGVQRRTPLAPYLQSAPTAGSWCLAPQLATLLRETPMGRLTFLFTTGRPTRPSA